MSGRPADWPEPPPWVGYALGMTGCTMLVVIGVIAGGEARFWLVLAAVLGAVAIGTSR